MPALAARLQLVLTGTAKGLGAVLLVMCATLTLPSVNFGADSHAYWLAARRISYGAGPMSTDAYLYSPAFAQVLHPVASLPWPWFAILWSSLLGLTLAWLLAPLRAWAMPLWVAGLPEVLSGNVFILLAAVAALGLRSRSAWAFAALTKVSLCLGPVWFAVRREWRSLGVSLAVPGVVAAVSFALSPHRWVQWVTFLGAQASQTSHPLGAPIWPPLVVRVPLALIVVALGAKTGRRWTLPVGMVLASPVLWMGTFTMLAAVPRLRGSELDQPDPADPPQAPQQAAAGSSLSARPRALTPG